MNNTAATNFTIRPTWVTWSIYCYSVLAVAIVITNGILITVIGRTKKLHVSPHIYILALGLADFSVGLIAIPLTLTASLIDFLEHAYLCLAIHSLYVYPISLSVGVLSLLAFDRCIFITKPLRYRILVTRFKAIMALVIASICMFLWSFAPLFGWNRISLDFATVDSLTCLDSIIVMPDYILVSMIIIVLLESVQITCFAFIAYAAWKYRKNSKKMRASTQTQSNRPSISVRAVVVLALLVLTSATGWLPLLFVNAAYFDWFRSYEVKILHVEAHVFAFLGYLTSLINPLVYGFGTPAVKEAALKMFKRNGPLQERSTSHSQSSVTAL